MWLLIGFSAPFIGAFLCIAVCKIAEWLNEMQRED